MSEEMHYIKNDYCKQKLMKLKNKSKQSYQKLRITLKGEKSTEKRTQSRLN